MDYKINRKGNWYVKKVCESCHKEPSNYSYWYGKGTCNRCGATNNSTIVDCYKVILRVVRHYRWWELWKSEKTYEGRDARSRAWLNIVYASSMDNPVAVIQGEEYKYIGFRNLWDCTMAIVEDGKGCRSLVYHDTIILKDKIKPFK